MKNKKGFTLIELLAVILILGIIALIAIPTVNNIVKESTMNSFRTSAQNISASIEDKCQLEQLRNQEITKYYRFENGEALETIDMQGSNPDNGSIVVDDDCEVSLVLNKGEYIAIKEKDSDNVTVIEEEYYVSGTKVIYDPGDSTYTNWNVLKDNGETVTLILNRNIGTGGNYAFEWASSTDYEEAGGTDEIYTNLGPITAVKNLKSLTDSWNIEAKENIRLITVEDVLEVLCVNTWDKDILYFDTKSNVKPVVSGVSKYAWLFNNTSVDCISNGCEEELDGTSSYWTQSKVENEDMVYIISNYGNIVKSYNTVTTINGTTVFYLQIRPVITISKELIQ